MNIFEFYLLSVCLLNKTFATMKDFQVKCMFFFFFVNIAKLMKKSICGSLSLFVLCQSSHKNS